MFDHSCFLDAWRIKLTCLVVATLKNGTPALLKWWCVTVARSSKMQPSRDGFAAVLLAHLLENGTGEMSCGVKDKLLHMHNCAIRGEFMSTPPKDVLSPIQRIAPRELRHAITKLIPEALCDSGSCSSTNPGNESTRFLQRILPPYGLVSERGAPNTAAHSEHNHVGSESVAGHPSDAALSPGPGAVVARRGPYRPARPWCPPTPPNPTHTQARARTSPHACTRAHKPARMHARTRAHTHTRPRACGASVPASTYELKTLNRRRGVRGREVSRSRSNPARLPILHTDISFLPCIQVV